jgi:hypothetical protein
MNPDTLNIEFLATPEYRIQDELDWSALMLPTLQK